MGAIVEVQQSLPGIPAPISSRSGDYLELLIRQGAALEVQQKYMDLRDREEARQAKMAFTEAKARFFAEEIRITKDKINKQYGNSPYTSLGNMVNTVRPYLGKHGFDVRWEIKQESGLIHVECILTHEMGHSTSASISVPPDTSGGDKGKNPIQQIKSAITYARNVTFETVCGLASTDDKVNVDDDANSAYGHVEPKGVQEAIDKINDAGDKAMYSHYYKEAYNTFEDNPTAIKSIVAAAKAKREKLGIK